MQAQSVKYFSPALEKKGNTVYIISLQKNNRIRDMTSKSLILFISFFKISAVAVGGGLTMYPLIMSEFTERRKWISQEEMMDCFAVVQSLPGLIGINMAVAVGYRIAGIVGGLMATFGMALPPVLTILLISTFFLEYSGNLWVERAFLCIRSAICALILLAAVKMGKNILKAPFPIFVAAAAFIVFTVFPDVNAVWVLIAAAEAGVIYSLVHREKMPAAKDEEKKQ